MSKQCKIPVDVIYRPSPSNGQIGLSVDSVGLAYGDFFYCAEMPSWEIMKIKVLNALVQDIDTLLKNHRYRHYLDDKERRLFKIIGGLDG